jgi:micrococcal nuclease
MRKLRRPVFPHRLPSLRPRPFLWLLLSLVVLVLVTWQLAHPRRPAVEPAPTASNEAEQTPHEDLPRSSTSTKSDRGKFKPGTAAKAGHPDIARLPEGLYRVAKVVDGDTLVLTNGAHVRLIGCNAPETVKPFHPAEPWGPDAKEFTTRFVRRGEVRLQFGQERIDKYGRLLAYVWVDDELLNEALIRAGLARASPQYKYSAAMKLRFLAAEAAAKAERRGIWSRQ